jgi:hypothetical protein
VSLDGYLTRVSLKVVLPLEVLGSGNTSDRKASDALGRKGAEFQFDPFTALISPREYAVKTPNLQVCTTTRLGCFSQIRVTSAR